MIKPVFDKFADPYCGSCALVQLGGKHIGPEGKGTSRVAIFHDAPGDREEKEGLPLRPRGSSGSVIESAIKLANYTREQFVLSNVVSCRPPGNELVGKPYEIGAINSCSGHVNRVIQEYKPTAILALGDVASAFFTGLSGRKRGSLNVRGYIQDNIRMPSIPVVVAPHPAYILHAKKPVMRRILIHDLKRAVTLAAKGMPARPDRRKWNTFCSESDLESLYLRLKAAPELPIFVDIETDFSMAEDEDRLRANDNGEAFLSRKEEDFEGTLPGVLTSEEEEEEGNSLTNEEAIWASITKKSNITKIQFGSIWPGEIWVSYWDNSLRSEWAKKIIALPNVKIGWNSDNFDAPLLRAHGAQFDRHHLDLMNLFHRFQPDYPMALQSATSFYWYEAEPWKHLNQAGDGIYECYDIGSMQNIMPSLMKQVEQVGVTGTFFRQDLPFKAFLNDICMTGYPINAEKQKEFGNYLGTEEQRLAKEMQCLVPEECKNFHPKEGYKKKPKEDGKYPEGYVYEDLVEAEFVVKEVVNRTEGLLASSGKLMAGVKAELLARYDDKQVEELDPNVAKWFKKKKVTTGRLITEKRWAFRKPFNANSSDQLLNYIRYRCEEEERVQPFKTKRRWYIPEHPSQKGKPTTGVKELERLGRATGDQFLLGLPAYRKIVKYQSFTKGAWVPNPHTGRVHATPKLSPATGQIAMQDPNILQGPKHGNTELEKRLAHQWLGVIMAPPSHRWVIMDFAGFHAATTGFEAHDPTYVRASRLDIHGILGYVNEKLPNYERIIEGLKDERLMSDAEILDRVKTWARKEVPGFKERRDQQYKRTVLGVQFGMRQWKMAKLFPEQFTSPKIAEKIITAEQYIWPKVFQFQDKITHTADIEHKLVSLYGHIRWFWDVFTWKWQEDRLLDAGGKLVRKPGEDSEKAKAFLPANDAFGHVRDIAVWMYERGLHKKYQTVNNIHDNLESLVPSKLVEEYIHVIGSRAQAPNYTLKNSTFPYMWFGVEFKTGTDGGAQNDLQEVKWWKQEETKIIDMEITDKLEWRSAVEQSLRAVYLRDAGLVI